MYYKPHIKKLGIILDNWLAFEAHLKGAVGTTNNTLSILCKLQNILSRATLTAIYIKPLAGHVCTTVISFIIKLITTPYMRKLNQLNIMIILRELESLEEHQKKNCTKN